MPDQVRKDVALQTEKFTFSGSGTIYSFTTVTDPPAGYEEQTPYVLALVKLDEGPLLTAQITDIAPDEPPAIGDSVEMVTRKLTTEGERGVILYGYKFRRVLPQA